MGMRVSKEYEIVDNRVIAVDGIYMKFKKLINSRKEKFEIIKEKK